MEFLNSTISVKPQNSPAIPLFTWSNRINPLRPTIANSRKLPMRSPFSLYLSRPIPSISSQISAHLGRPTNRQNYLRKKLTQQQQQLEQVRQNQFHEIDSVDIYESNFGSSSGIVEKKRSRLDAETNSDTSGDLEGVKELKTELRKNKLGKSIALNKLENWVEQHKKDSEFWGIGVGPIFTIFQDSEGKLERVVVNEDEIMRRSRVGLSLDNENQNLDEVNFKISFAKDLAKEVMNGDHVIPKNSSVAKFVLSAKDMAKETMNNGSVAKVVVSSAESNLIEPIRRCMTLARVPINGVFLLCGFLAVWAIRGLFRMGVDSKEYTRLEKEMLRRKMKARMEKEKAVKGTVEVMQDPIDPGGKTSTRPQLDKEKLLSSIMKEKGSKRELEIVEYTEHHNKEFKDKIEEIREMARRAREIEKSDSLPDHGDGDDDQVLKEFSTDSSSSEDGLPFRDEVYATDFDEAKESMPFADTKYDIEQSADEALMEKGEKHVSNFPNGTESSRLEACNMKPVLEFRDSNDANQNSDGLGCQSGLPKNSLRKKFRIIKSAKEAREYLSRKYHISDVNQELEDRTDVKTDTVITMPTSKTVSGNTGQILDSNEVDDISPSSGIHDSSHPYKDFIMDNERAQGNVNSLNDSEKSQISSGHETGVSNQDGGISAFDIPGKEETYDKTSEEGNYKTETSPVLGCTQDNMTTEVHHGGATASPLEKHNSESNEENETLTSVQMPGITTANKVHSITSELAPLVNKDNWIEKNFHEFEPIVKKIGAGFRGNYLAAREKSNEKLDLETQTSQLKYDGAQNELEWMKDERLKKIVFRVRDNELSGRDPFHLMDEEDKRMFFIGLEKKVEQENEKLLNLHEYLHSNIENLDYGADGISLYDPPEKIIPRWKVPPAENTPEFLNKFMEQREPLVAESLKNSSLSKNTGRDIIQKPEEPSPHENTPVPAGDVDRSTKLQNESLVSSRTIIQGSDGSVRSGKKSGKEYWQHTKKWSQGFVDSYNEETDPEVKAVMKDIGKDLDRWITEKEIQEAAELMDKIPKKGRDFIKCKFDKVKREMELFGPQAVVSKYREYADEKEEDYLWWLDLPYVLCIELYTVEKGEERVGFYSLEMAADLELDPKPYHVIAFEDAGDCKNLCYIIQAKMEVLGNGNAFVVARPPKDAFREAKANGFSVTVVRKGQLQLNIDQTLEAAEESIIEIGSKIYHDIITKERSVDINALMKGVFGVRKPAANRKRLKQKLKRRTELKDR